MAYKVFTRLVAAYLQHGLSDTDVYLAGSGASREVVVGLSDVDLVVLLGGDKDEVAQLRGIVLRRWRRLQRLLGPAKRAVGIALYSERDLADGDGGTALTYGLAGREAAIEATGGYLRPGRPVDDLYRRLHPGIYGPGRGWTQVGSRHRTPQAALRNPDYRRLAAWLEMQWWWRFAYELCVSEKLDFASYLSFKLVAEPARIWLWLGYDIRPQGRRQAVEAALAFLPEEEHVLRGALDLHARLPRHRTPPRAETLAWLLRMGDRIARLLQEELRPHGSLEVKLRDGAVVPRREGREALEKLSAWAPIRCRVPLADWRSRAMPHVADELLVTVEADPCEPSALGGLARSAVTGLQPAVKAGSLLVLPADASTQEVLLRAVQIAGFDPVSFALLENRSVASFPEVAGLSAADCARRAVDEHAAWLGFLQPDETLGEVDFGRLFTAARAALFLETIGSSDPQLPLSAGATVKMIAELHGGDVPTAEDAYAGFIQWRTEGERPPAGLILEFTGEVKKLVRAALT